MVILGFVPLEGAMPIAAARHRIRRTLAISLVLTLAGVGSAIPATALAAAPAPRSAAVTVPHGATLLDDTVTFSGRGYGHGVGLSQYGARGRALDGQDAATILAHYYQGTTPGATDPKRPIRILVRQALKPTATKPLKPAKHPWPVDEAAA